MKSVQTFYIKKNWHYNKAPELTVLVNFIFYCSYCSFLSLAISSSRYRTSPALWRKVTATIQRYFDIQIYNAILNSHFNLYIHSGGQA